MVNFRPTEIRAQTTGNTRKGSKGGIENRYCEYQEPEEEHTRAQGNFEQDVKGYPTTASTRRTTLLGNFRFLPEVTVQNILSPIEEIISKAPQDYDTFITIKTTPLDEGGSIGEKFVLDQFHTICDNLWAADPTIVIYTYPGKIQHSSYVIPYKKKHTRVPQSKIYRKIASLPELKRYID